MFNRLLLLMVTHLLYDFHWQGEFIGTGKSKSWFLLFVHAATWSTLLFLVARFYGGVSWTQLPILFVGHFVIDMWKCRYTRLEKLGSALWIDQVLHVAQVIWLWLA